MSITYGLVTEMHELNGEKRITYGITAYADVAECGTASPLCSVKDLSHDRDTVLDTVRLLNESHASLLHFEELIDDYLAKN